MRAVGAHRDGIGPVEPVDAADAVLEELEEHEHARLRVPAEDHQRVVVAAGDVDVEPIGADGDGAGAQEAGHTVHALLLDLDEGELAALRVAGEDRDGVVERSRRIDVRPVGADRDALGATEAGDVRDAVSLHLDEGERTGARLTREDGERVVVPAGHVDVGAVGAHGDALGAVEAVHPTDAVVLRLYESERARRGIACVDGERVADLRGHIDERAVGADGHAMRALQPP